MGITRVTFMGVSTERQRRCCVDGARAAAVAASCGVGSCGEWGVGQVLGGAGRCRFADGSPGDRTSATGRRRRSTFGTCGTGLTHLVRVEGLWARPR